MSFVSRKGRVRAAGRYWTLTYVGGKVEGGTGAETIQVSAATVSGSGSVSGP
jgi:hypothetical protein